MAERLPGLDGLPGQCRSQAEHARGGSRRGALAPGIGTLKPVEFFEPFSKSGAAKLALAARGATGDQIVDGNDSPDARRLVGNDDSNLIIADDDRKAETMIGKDGLDILEGAGGRQVMLGGDGLDVLTADAGDDSDLDGGPGPDSLYGGEGDDEIRDDSGDNRILGGEGRDVLATWATRSAACSARAATTASCSTARGRSD